MEAWGERRIRAWQGLALMGALALVVVQLLDVNRPEMIVQRTLLGTVMLGAAALMQQFKERAAEIFTTLCFVVAWWTMAYIAVEPVLVESALLVLVTTAALGLVLPTFSARAAFLLMVMLSSAVSMSLLQPKGVPGPFVVACVAIITVIVLIHGYVTDQTSSEVGELSLVASRVHNGVALLDTSGRIEWVNASFMKLAGRTAEELHGRRLLDLLRGPQAEEDSVEDLAEALRHGHQASVELPHRSALGNVTWVSVDLTPVRDGRGQLQRYIAVETDISRARAFLARILDSMTDMLLVVQEGRGIRSANQAACHLLDLAEGELIGRPLEEFLDDTGGGPVAEGASRLRMLLTRRMTPAPGSAFGDLDLQLKNGRGGAVPVRASAAVLSDEPDQPRLVVIVARDVRDRLRLQEERRQLEEKIRQGQKLESLGVLAGGIAHDFNNLLVGILGNASLAASLAEGNDSAKLLQRIERSAQRASDLTRQMLAYSGKGRFEIVEIGIPELVRELSELIDASISKQAKLRMEFDEELPAVEGDPTQLRQVVMNLLTNASEAIGEGGGDVVVRGRSTVLSATEIEQLVVASETMRAGTYVEIAVRDAGHGMDSQTLGRMFDPFFTTKATGRGLGLAATLGIVRGHGGGLAVETAPDQGTTMRVFLPPSTRPAAPASDGVEEPASVWSGEGAVLVADDEEEVREFIEAVLEGRGFTVITAGDGQECVDAFRANIDRVGLVVLDMTMPVMNGDEALREIRLLSPDVRVILSSGYDEQEAIARFGDIGPAVFLQKPYRAAQLIEVVREQLGDA